MQKSTASIVNQRKVTLHGVRARETPEELNEREIRREIRLLIPDIFSGGYFPQLLLSCVDEVGLSPFVPCVESVEPQPMLHPMGPGHSDLTTFLSSPRYEQVRTVRQWLLPLLLKILPE